MPAKKTTTKGKGIGESIKELEGIVAWFEGEDTADIEAGLSKVKEGVVLVKDLKKKLEEVMNEFSEITADLEEE